MPKHPVRVLFLILLATGCLSAQQRAVTHADYDDWKSLRGTAYSHDGSWVAYQIEPQWGDGVLIVRQTNGDHSYRYERGSGARFSADGRFVAFTVEDSKVEARDKKIEELRQQAKKQREGGETEGVEQGRGAGGPGGAVAAAARRRGAGAGVGRRGGGRFGRGGGGGGASASGSGDLRLLDLTTGEVESIGKVRRWLLADDVDFLMYQKQGDAPETGEEDDTDGGSGEQPPAGPRGGGRPGAQPPSTEPEPLPGEPAATGEPTVPGEPAVPGEPVVVGEPTVPGTGEAGAAGGRGAARRRGGRTGRPETPADPLEQKRPAGYELTVRDFPFPLLCDTKREMGVAYGAAAKPVRAMRAASRS